VTETLLEELPPMTEGEEAPVIVLEPVGQAAVKRIFPAVKCRYCDFELSGGFAGARVGKHERREHADVFTERDKAPAKSPAKKATAKKVAAPRAGRSTPAPGARRLDGSEFVGMVVGGIGSAMVMGGLGPRSTALALQWEAPVAGRVLDKALSGTFIDKMAVQPATRALNSSKSAGSVLAFPVLLGLIEMQPTLLPMLEPSLRFAATQLLKEMIPVLEAQEKEAQEVAKTLARLGQLDPTFDVPDPVGLFLSGFLARPEPEQDPNVE